ncbi:hypothetical protein [Saccharomonospora halophila]|uniref:hypothetical protein n=1 Tax=Saccharomonospora halophila TaxID=129922 RepID=UPI00035D9193|nr:hypothetical protein [Saccharomonospora halophila]
MTRLSTKVLGVVAGAVVGVGMSAGVAVADHQKVDGTITSGGDTCSWTNADATDNPPNTLTVDAASVNANTVCDGDKDVTLNNDPTISFDDAAGTATADLINVTVVSYGVTCEYEATGLTAQREGDTRTYTATDVTLDKSGGSWMCPSSETADAEFVFH